MNKPRKYTKVPKTIDLNGDAITNYMIGYNTAYDDLEKYFEKIIEELNQEIRKLKEKSNSVPLFIKYKDYVINTQYIEKIEYYRGSWKIVIRSSPNPIHLDFSKEAERLFEILKVVDIEEEK